jgi:hypothetical protein
MPCHRIAPTSHLAEVPNVRFGESAQNSAHWPMNTQVRKSAPRARGDGPVRAAAWGTWTRCSPRTRGWSLHQRVHRGLDQVLPAHAGMVPCRRAWGGPCPCAPRARGDGPGQVITLNETGLCSPRTRGWSLRLAALGPVTVVLPAHAGMVPIGACKGPRAARAPRACGDVPRLRRTRSGIRGAPHARGIDFRSPCIDGCAGVGDASTPMRRGSYQARASAMRRLASSSWPTMHLA